MLCELLELGVEPGVVKVRIDHPRLEVVDHGLALLAQEDVLGHPAAQAHHQVVHQLLLGAQVAVLLGQVEDVAERAAARTQLDRVLASVRTTADSIAQEIANHIANRDHGSNRFGLDIGHIRQLIGRELGDAHRDFTGVGDEPFMTFRHATLFRTFHCVLHWGAGS